MKSAGVAVSSSRRGEGGDGAGRNVRVRNVAHTQCGAFSLECHAQQMNDASDLLQDLGVTPTKAHTHWHTHTLPHTHTPALSQAFRSLCGTCGQPRLRLGTAPWVGFLQHPFAGYAWEGWTEVVVQAATAKGQQLCPLSPFLPLHPQLVVSAPDKNLDPQTKWLRKRAPAKRKQPELIWVYSHSHSHSHPLSLTLTLSPSHTWYPLWPYHCALILSGPAHKSRVGGARNRRCYLTAKRIYMWVFTLSAGRSPSIEPASQTAESAFTGCHSSSRIAQAIWGDFSGVYIANRVCWS